MVSAETVLYRNVFPHPGWLARSQHYSSILSPRLFMYSGRSFWERKAFSCSLPGGLGSGPVVGGCPPPSTLPGLGTLCMRHPSSSLSSCLLSGFKLQGGSHWLTYFSRDLKEATDLWSSLISLVNFREL